MLKRTYAILSDPTKGVASDAVFVSGQPMSMNIDGQVEVTTEAKVYGLTLLTKNPYKDETFGETGMQGSKLVTIVKRGVIDIGPSTFVKDDQTEELIYPYDNALTYVANEKLYVNKNTGLIVNTNPEGNADVNSATYLGDVILPSYTDNTGEVVMQIDLKC